MLRILAAAFCVILLGLQLTWWQGKGGVRDARKLQAQIKSEELALEGLRSRNSKLAAEVMDLKRGLETVEEIARSEMGMIKEGEIFYQMIEPPAGAVAGESDAARSAAATSLR